MDIHTKKLKESFSDMASLLLKATEGCRTDMHEPDEQGLSAKVIGEKLDNAFGEDVTINGLTFGYQEMVFVLIKNDVKTFSFNMASLLALARYGAWKLLNEAGE